MNRKRAGFSNEKPGPTAQISVKQTPIEQILPFRDLYRQEMNCQIVHDSIYQRNAADTFLVLVRDRIAGYGAVGFNTKRDTVYEFYLLSEFRSFAAPAFQQFLAASKAKKIRAQTNDTQLTLLLFDFAHRIVSDTILFHDVLRTNLSPPNVIFRPATENDKNRIFAHQHEPVGGWLAEVDGEIVGTAGYLTHYNPPYGDIFMEVSEQHRRRGYGSFLVQEVKRMCNQAGKAPAARCNIANVASRRTLERAGLLPCARILVGDVNKRALSTDVQNT